MARLQMKEASKRKGNEREEGARDEGETREEEQHACILVFPRDT